MERARGWRERQKAEAVKRLYEAILEAVAGCFEIPQSTRGQAAGVARTVTRNFELAARKMTGVRWSHLMHPMNQGFILSDSQKGIALMRRGLRA